MKEAFEVAAKWWAEFLRQPVVHDNGDDASGTWINRMAAATRPTMSEEQIATFERELARLLAEQFTDSRKLRGGRLWVSVDYDPDDVLSAALRAAGIAGYGVLPCKTSCFIGPGRVVLGGSGYGRPDEVLFDAREQAEKAT